MPNDSTKSGTSRMRPWWRPRRSLFVVLSLFLFVFISAHCGKPRQSDAAQNAPSPPIPPGRYAVVPERSRVSAFVRSTLHDFDTVARKFSGEVVIPPGGVPGAVRLRLEFAADELTTGNILRDAAMRGQALHTEKYPKVVFESRSVELLGSNGGAWSFRVTGKFSLHGITREIAVPVLVRRESGALASEGKIALRLSDYKIDPPSLPFIHVEDEVEVRARFVLERER